VDLRPGRYRFRVIACNNDGVWNGGSRRNLGFQSPRPAWYQTNWFRSLCAVFGVFPRGRSLPVARAANCKIHRHPPFDERLARTQLAWRGTFTTRSSRPFKAASWSQRMRWIPPPIPSPNAVELWNSCQSGFSAGHAGGTSGAELTFATPRQRRQTTSLRLFGE